MLALVQHLVGAKEACEILGVSRQRLQYLAERPDFPRPVAVLSLGRVWETAAIREYARRTGRLADEDDAPA
jgi:predicted DNA-binding transcriptional regulator AlpA